MIRDRGTHSELESQNGLLWKKSHAIKRCASIIKKLTEPQQPASSLQRVRASSVFVKLKMNYWEVI